MTSNKQSGFTLLELSIVLVIIGLIVGGITVGSSMIRAAELRAIITESDRYKTAVHTFRDKYLAYPGDMGNAIDFWGPAHGTAATCVTTASTGTETCNGDSDGTVDVSTGSNERFRFWQHLANAGLVEGSFNGIAGSGGTDDTELYTTVNSPQSKLSGTGWSIQNFGALTGDGTYFTATYRNHLIFGTDTTAGSTTAAALTPEDAWNIDKKVDDGKPGQGAVLAFSHSACTDAANGNDTIDDYDLDNSVISCGLIFNKLF